MARAAPTLKRFVPFTSQHRQPERHQAQPRQLRRPPHLVLLLQGLLFFRFLLFFSQSASSSFLSFPSFFPLQNLSRLSRWCDQQHCHNSTPSPPLSSSFSHAYIFLHSFSGKVEGEEKGGGGAGGRRERGDKEAFLPFPLPLFAVREPTTNASPIGCKIAITRSLGTFFFPSSLWLRLWHQLHLLVLLPRSPKRHWGGRRREKEKEREHLGASLPFLLSSSASPARKRGFSFTFSLSILHTPLKKSPPPPPPPSSVCMNLIVSDGWNCQGVLV